MTTNNLSLRSALKRALARSTTAFGALLPALALAGPQGEQVVAGAVSVGRPDALNTLVTQTTQNAVVNWQSFDVGGEELVQFLQPNSSSVILNRVIGGSASSIFGDITANGHVFLVNTQGVYFAPGARVDVQGLFASTLDIADSDFMSGQYAFARAAGAPDAGVVNDGVLTAQSGGFVVLAGDYASNTGVVAASAGTVALTAGSRVTLDLVGDGLINFAVDEAALGALAGVSNAGTLEGGTVVMTARVANSLTGTVVNNTGVIRAQSIEDVGGEVWLAGAGGTVVHSGQIEAAGGQVVVYGEDDVTLADGGTIAAEGGTVRAIAVRDLDFQAGAAIAADGGLVELSGYDGLRLDGAVSVAGGTLIIDPSTLTIQLGSTAPGNTTTSFNTVGVDFVESALNSGANVHLVASGTITASSSVTAISAAGLGALYVEIGTVSTTPGDCQNFGVCVGPLGAPNFAAVSGGSIDLAGVDINIGGIFNAEARNGTISLGDVTAAGIYINVNPANTVNAGALAAGSSDVVVVANQLISVANVSAVGSVGLQVDTNSGGVIEVLGPSSSGGITAGGAIALQALGGDSGSGPMIDIGTGGINAGGGFTALASGSSGADARIRIGGNVSATTISLQAINTDGAGGSVSVGGFVHATQTGGNVLIEAIGAHGSLEAGKIFVDGDIQTVGLGNVTLNAQNDLGGSGAYINVEGGITAHDVNLTADAVHDSASSIGGLEGGQIFIGTVTGPSDITGASINAAGNLNVSARGGVDGGLFMGGAITIDGTASIIVFAYDEYGQVILADDITGGVITDYANLSALSVNIDADADMSAGNIAATGGNIFLQAVETISVGNVTATGAVDIDVIHPDAALLQTSFITAARVDLNLNATGGTGNVTMALDGATANGTANGDDIKLLVTAGTGLADATLTVFNDLNAAGNVVDIDVTAADAATVSLGSAGAAEFNLQVTGTTGTVMTDDLTAPRIIIDTNGRNLTLGALNAISSVAPVIIDINASQNSSTGGDIVMGAVTAQGRNDGTNPFAVNALVLTTGTGNVTVNGNVSVNGIANPYTRTVGIQSSGSAAWTISNFEAGEQGAMTINGTSVNVSADGTAEVSLRGGTVDLTGVNVVMNAAPANRIVNDQVLACVGSPPCTLTVDRNATAFGGPTLNVHAQENAPGHFVTVGNITLSGVGAVVDIEGTNITAGNISVTATGRADVRTGTMVIGSAAPVAFSESDNLGQALVNIHAGFGGPTSTVTTGNIAVSGIGNVGVTVQADDIQVGSIDATAQASTFVHSGPRFTPFRLNFDQWPGNNLPMTEGQQTLGLASVLLGGQSSGEGLTNAVDIDTGAIDVSGAGIATVTLRGTTVDVTGPVNISATAGTQDGVGTASGGFSIDATGGQAMFNLIDQYGPVTANLGAVTVTGPAAVVDVNVTNLTAGNITANTVGTQTLLIDGAPANAPASAAYLVAEGALNIGHLNTTGYAYLQNTGVGATALNTGNITARRVNLTLDNTGTSGPAVSATLGNVTATGSGEQGEINLSISGPDFSNGATLTAGALTTNNANQWVTVDGGVAAAVVNLGNVTAHEFRIDADGAAGSVTVGDIDATRWVSVIAEQQDITVGQVDVITSAHSAVVELLTNSGDISATGINAQGHVSEASNFVPRAVWLNVRTPGSGNVTIGTGGLFLRGTGGTYDRVVGNLTEDYDSAGWVSANVWAGPSGTLTVNGDIDAQGVGFTYIDVRGGIVQFGAGADVFIDGTGQVRTQTRNYACGSGCTELWVRESEAHGGATFWVNNGSGAAPYAGATVDVNNVSVSGPFANVTVNGADVTVGAVTVVADGRAVDTRTGSRTIGSNVDTFAETDSLGSAFLRLGNTTAVGSGGAVTVTGNISVTGLGQTQLRIDADTIDLQGAVSVTTLPETYTRTGDYQANQGQAGFARNQWQVPGFQPTLRTGTVTSGLTIVDIGQIAGSGSLLVADNVDIGSLTVNGVGDVRVNVHAHSLSIDGAVTVHADAATVVSGAGSYFSSGEALIPFTTAGTGGRAQVSLHTNFDPGDTLLATGNIAVTGPEAELLVEARTVVAQDITADATGTLIDGDAGGSAAELYVNGYGIDAGTVTADGFLEVAGTGTAPSHSILLDGLVAPNIQVINHGGGIDIGTVTAVNATGPASVYLDTNNAGGVTVGSITIQGRTAPDGGHAAMLNIETYPFAPNNITLGNVSVTGIGAAVAFSGSTEFGPSAGAGFIGEVLVDIDAGSYGMVDIAALSVSGVGAVDVVVHAGGGVAIADVDMSVTPANFSVTASTSCAENCDLTRTDTVTAGGYAGLFIDAGSDWVELDTVDITGPSVFVNVRGADIWVSGAVNLTATGINETLSSTGTASNGSVTVNYQRVRQGAPVVFNADAYSFSGAGSVTLAGPVTATGTGIVSVDVHGDSIVTGNITLNAAAGTWTHTGEPWNGSFGPFSMGPMGPMDMADPFKFHSDAFPRIDQGTITGGRALLTIDGGQGGCTSFCGDFSLPASAVDLGALSVTGAGEARVLVNADGFVDFNGAVTLNAGIGTINGTGTEDLYGSSSESPPIGSVARTVSGTFGRATLDVSLEGPGSGLDVLFAGPLTVQGPTAEVSVESFATLAAGNITVTGTGGVNLIMTEAVDLFGTGPGAVDYQVQYTGNGQPTSVDIWADAGGTIAVGNLAVSGVGLVGAFLVADSGVTAGTVTLTATDATYSLNDTRNGLGPVTQTVGDVAVGVFEGSCNSSACMVTGRAALTGLSVTASRNAWLGVVGDATGPVSVTATAGNINGGDLPVFIEGLANIGEDGPSEDTNLPTTDLTANGLALRAGGAILLDGSTLISGTGAAPGALADSAVTAAFTLGALQPTFVAQAGTTLDLGTLGTSGTGWVQLSASNFAPVAASSFAAGTVVQVSMSNPTLALGVETAAGPLLNDTNHGALFDATYLVLGSSTQVGPVIIGASGLNLGTTEVALISQGNINGSGTLAAAGIVVDSGDVANVNLVTNSGSITLADGGAVSVNNSAFTGSAIFEVPAGTYTSLNLSTGGDLTLLGATTTTAGLSLTAAGGITLDGAQTSNVTSFNAGTFFTTTGGAINAATLSLSGSATTDYVLTGSYDTLIIGTADQVTVTDTGGLTVDFGTGTYGAVSITTTGGVLTLVDGLNAASATLSGAGVALGSAPITTSGALTLTTTGALSGTGLVTAGSLVLNGAAATAISLSTSTTSIDVNGGSTVTLSNSATGATTLDLLNSTATALTYTGGGATSVLGGFNGSALSLTSGGNLTLGGSAYTATGTLAVSTPGTFTAGGALFTAGTLNLSGGSGTNFGLTTNASAINVSGGNFVVLDNSAQTGALALTTSGVGPKLQVVTGGALTHSGGYSGTDLLLSGASVALGGSAYTTTGTMHFVTGGAFSATGLLTAGSLTLDGAASTNWGLDVSTASLSVLGGNTVQIDNSRSGTASISFEAGTYGTVDLVFAGGAVLASDLAASSLILEAGLLTAGDAVLAGSTVTTTGGLLVSTGNGGDIDVTGASLTAGGVLALTADGDVTGESIPAAQGSAIAPRAAAAVGTLSGASVVITGDNILLGDTVLVIGNGASVPSGASDPVLRQGLIAGGLAPVGAVADGTLLSGGVLELGGVTMTGDYLVLQGTSLDLNSTVSGPANLVTQITSAVPNGSISLENSAGTAATLNLSTATLAQLGSGTVVLGSGSNNGAVTFGTGGPVNLGALNFVAATSGTISDLALVTSTGLVRSLASLLGSVVVNPTPILTDIDPGVANPSNPVNTSAGTSSGGGEEEDDEEGEDTDQSGDTSTSEEEPLIKQESADTVGVCK